MDQATIALGRPGHQNTGRVHVALSQKILLVILLGLLVLMVVFFMTSLENRGPEKYQACMEKKCAGKSESLCNFTIKRSCCISTGGQFVRQNKEYGCAFS